MRRKTVAKIALVSVLIILAVVSAVAYLSNAYRISFPWERSGLISSDIEIQFRTQVYPYGWSPGDNRILYTYEAELCTMNPDGSNKIVLFSAQSEEIEGFEDAAYAPDGKRIAFTGYLYGSEGVKGLLENIYMINADGTNLVKLTSDNVSKQPSWSPDGERIVFVRDSDLWVMNSEGTRVRQLTNTPAGEYLPIWSPDGKRIAFVLGKNTVCIINPEGGEKTIVPVNSTIRSVEGWSWSQDSSVIVASDGEDIWAFTIDGQTIRRLIATIDSDLKPVLSHDGQKIAYATFLTGSWGAMNLRVASLSRPLTYENLAESSSALPTSLPWPFSVIGKVIVEVIAFFGIIFLAIFLVVLGVDRLVKKAAGKKQGKLTERDCILMIVSVNGSSTSCFNS